MVKIVTWNVNSVKARHEHVCNYLKLAEPDILLLQELKLTEKNFPRVEFEDLGYNCAVVGQKAYNGVAILSKLPIDVAHTELPGDPSDEQARYIEAIIGGIRVASIYLPNGNPIDTEKFPYKLDWMERLYHHAKSLLETEETVILGGDYNVIQDKGDVYDPVGFADEALFQPETRAAFRKILHLGYTEAYRAIHSETGQYSWWGYMAGAWQKDNGVRIDHLLLSPQAADRLTACDIDRRPRGWEKPSDHTPVWCEFNETN